MNLIVPCDSLTLIKCVAFFFGRIIGRRVIVDCVLFTVQISQVQWSQSHTNSVEGEEVIESLSSFASHFLRMLMRSSFVVEYAINKVYATAFSQHFKHLAKKFTENYHATIYSFIEPYIMPAEALYSLFFLQINCVGLFLSVKKIHVISRLM